MEIVDHAVQNGTLDDVYKAAADMPVLARTTHTRPASGGGYSPVGVQRLRDLNELNFGYGGAIPAGGVLAGLMGGNDDQSMV